MSQNMWGLPGVTYEARGANRYVADAGGFLGNVANIDVNDLLSAGVQIMSPGRVIGRLLAANMNVTTDQAIALQVPTGARYRVTEIWCAGATISLTTAAGGIYTATAKGGTALVAATQAYTAYTGPTVLAGLTVVAAQLALIQTANPLYLSLTTGQGAAANCDFFVFGDLLG